jgi:hypothetical protein
MRLCLLHSRSSGRDFRCWASCHLQHSRHFTCEHNGLSCKSTADECNAIAHCIGVWSCKLVWPRSWLIANRNISTCNYRSVETRADKQAVIATTKAHYSLQCTIGTRHSILKVCLQQQPQVEPEIEPLRHSCLIVVKPLLTDAENDFCRPSKDFPALT